MYAVIWALESLARNWLLFSIAEATVFQ